MHKICAYKKVGYPAQALGLVGLVLLLLRKKSQEGGRRHGQRASG